MISKTFGQDALFDPMKIRRHSSLGTVDAPFKMKRSRQQILASQPADSISNVAAFLDSESEGEIDDGYADEGYGSLGSWQTSFAPSHRKQSIESEVDDSDGELVSDLFKNRGPSKPKDSNTTASLFAAAVVHPWHIIDYHLYLLQIESRKGGILLRDGVDCRPLSYDEMFEVDTFDPNLVGDEPSVLFAALPVPENRVQFNGATYVLEYDWNLRTLCARHFFWVPEDLRHVDYVWTEGVIVYVVQIMQIIDVMRASLDQRYRRIEFLSTNPLCTNGYMTQDDPGMELVVAYMFCQFAVDFAEALLPEKTDDGIEDFRSELTSIMDEVRLTLQRASYRAWFAVREGLSMEKFSHKVSFDRYLNDLFTYNRSVEEGSLRSKKWHAPGLSTCKKIRDTDAKNRQAKNELRLKDMFAPIDPHSEEHHEEVFEQMLTKTDKSEADSLLSKEPLYIPSSSWYELDFDTSDMSPGSPTAMSPTDTHNQDFEVTEFNHIPLWRLLNRTLELLQDRPELDTLENRGRFGALLTDMGARLLKKSLDSFAIVPTQGYDHDDWCLDVHDLSDSEESAAPIRGLLPSPVID